ncbi:uncharacterized protein LOC128989837 [Macrosteles quadrilineatus]|uniref:uncharacterized protein LOC128989837 n=1 Tax=Macrosteles quadrilineatus TaxID=74068 RepID=UPI0023E25D44|nr:uncharacterized protein LOC128989837 [Macrosteles quadrilineatus]
MPPNLAHSFTNYLSHSVAKELSGMERFREPPKLADTSELQMVFTRRKAQRMQIRQAFYLVDSNYVKTYPNEFYIRSLSGQIFLIKYERFLR